MAIYFDIDGGGCLRAGDGQELHFLRLGVIPYDSIQADIWFTSCCRFWTSSAEFIGLKSRISSA